MSAPDGLDPLELRQALAGRYSLIRELGRGGMGVVYLAQEVRLDRPVALKVLPAVHAARPELRERFLREARTAARLSHPHIVPIHAVEELGGFVFFAMAFIEGETLGERIRAGGALPPREGARVLREVGWALGYAHAQGVVHRDVKPDNILLEAGSGRALVTDFGIARVGGDAAAELAGTAEFMSPEQAAGGPADARSDLYALGVVGYYMLSGRLPVQGSSTTATLARQIAQAPEPLATVTPRLPAALTGVVDRCLAKDPEARFATGEELAAALDPVFEERRALPAPLRLFVDQNRESSTALVGTEVFSVGALGVWWSLFATGIIELDWAVMIVPSLVWSALATGPGAMLVQMARRLQRAGYDHADLVRAMREELEARRMELARAETPADRRIDKWLNRLLVGGLGTHVGALGWMLFGPYWPGVGEGVIAALAASLATWISAGTAAAVRHQVREHVPGQGWLRFWESPLGRGVFSASKVGLGALPAGSPYGPTELAIGLAADRLYESLPAAQREAFAGLPDVVRRLESDAERMRAHIAGLESLLAGLGDEPVAAELRAARAAAEERLRRVVAALETIRIQLLRLHAGSAGPEGLTVDLGAAREVAEDVARLLDATREVDRLLGRPPPGLRLTPTPG